MSEAAISFPVKITKPKDEDESYVVYFPDFDEYLYAESFSDSFVQAHEFLKEHLLDDDLPEPSEVLPFAKEGQFTSFVTVPKDLVD